MTDADDAYATRWEDATLSPSGIQQRARSIARNITLTTLGSITLPFGRRFLRSIYCHSVFDDQTDRFEQLVIELKEVGTFVDTDTCIDMLEGNTEIDNRYFHLSFDDGFRNVATNALPILKKYSIPAIMFVPSSLVGADWAGAREFCMGTTRHKGVIEMVKWEDLREAVAAGFEVGSHTKTHARFSNISRNPALLEDEIRGSKLQIEEKLGTECRYISWPYGRVNDADNLSLNMTKESGYRACFGAFRGSIIAHQTARYAVPRHRFEVQWPMSHIKYFVRGNFERRAPHILISPS